MRAEPSQAEAQWYYERSGQRVGPISFSQLRATVARGGLAGSTLVWRSGWLDWQPLEVTELSDLPLEAALDSVAAPAPSERSWYYEWGGKRLGPLALAEMQALITKGTLSHGSLVWRAGMSGWAPIESTELGEQLMRTTPPPLSGIAINNSVVWLLAVSPVLIGLLRYALALADAHGSDALADRLMNQNRYWAAGPLVCIALSYWDEAVLKKAGVNTNQLGQAWLVPVYLFKRAKVLAQSPAYAWVWLGLFILGVLADF